MRITEYFIRRPVAGIVLSLLIFLCGLLCVFFLPIRLHPLVYYPIVTVNTNYPGASAITMENSITTPLELSIASIADISHVQSTSTNGSSVINVHFRLGTNIDKAMLNVMNSTARANKYLPQMSQQPIVSKVDSSLYSLLQLSVISPKTPPLELTRMINRVTLPSLLLLKGVGDVYQQGGAQPEILIRLNPLAMLANKVTVADVTSAIKNYNVYNLTGFVKNNQSSYAVMADTILATVKGFNNIIVKYGKNNNVRLKDIASVSDQAPALNNLAFINGKPANMFFVPAKLNANDLRVVSEVKKAIPTLERQLPKDTKIKVVLNRAEYIKSALLSTLWSLIAAIVIVILVVFFFLGSFRLMIVPLIALPISIVGVCSLMLLLGYSLNVFTLLAFILAIGLVVDDAIIVVERVFVHFCKKHSLNESALLTMKELKSAIVVMTLTLIIVYIPVAFAQGLAGQLFSSFCFTVAGSVIISGIVALTLSPMLCTKILPANFVGLSVMQSLITGFFSRVHKDYEKLLRFILKLRWLIILLAIIIYALCVLFSIIIPKTLLPHENKGYFYGLYSNPIGASPEYNVQQNIQLSKKLLALPGVATVTSQLFNGGSWLTIILKPWSQRKYTSLELIKKYAVEFNHYPGGSVELDDKGTFSSELGNISQFSLALTSATATYKQLNQAQKIMREKLLAWGGLYDVSLDTAFNTPQFNVKLDPAAAARAGVKPIDISNTINLFLTKQLVGNINKDGSLYSIYVEATPEFKHDIEAIKVFPVATKSGKQLPLASVARIQQVVVPKSLGHYQYQRTIMLGGMISPGFDQSQVLAKAKEIAATYLSHNITVMAASKTRREQNVTHTLGILLIAGVVLIYFLMTLLFNSFIAPIAVILTVPLALFGGLLCLWLTGGSLNLYTIIGFITLIGLISKHGILIVTFVQRLRAKGKELHHAVIAATAIRLRPVLMTTFAMALAAVPLMVIPGEGTHALHQIGWVIFGGMLIGTLFTLFVLPCVCMIVLPSRVVKSEQSVK